MVHLRRDFSLPLSLSLFFCFFFLCGKKKKLQAHSRQVRERQVAAALGLPSRIRDEDCDVEPLSATDLESEAACANNPLFGSCQPEHITYTIKMVEIARLRESICGPGSF